MLFRLLVERIFHPHLARNAAHTDLFRFSSNSKTDSSRGTGVAQTHCAKVRQTFVKWRSGELVDLRNQHVHFKISDIYIPDPHHLLWQLHGEDLLQGTVIELSDSGLQQEAFAVVQVEGIEQPMIVPVNRILCVTD